MSEPLIHTQRYTAIVKSSCPQLSDAACTFVAEEFERLEQKELVKSPCHPILAPTSVLASLQKVGAQHIKNMQLVLIARTLPERVPGHRAKKRLRYACAICHRFAPRGEGILGLNMNRFYVVRHSQSARTSTPGSEVFLGVFYCDGCEGTYQEAMLRQFSTKSVPLAGRIDVSTPNPVNPPQVALDVCGTCDGAGCPVCRSDTPSSHPAEHYIALFQGRYSEWLEEQTKGLGADEPLMRQVRFICSDCFDGTVYDKESDDRKICTTCKGDGYLGRMVDLRKPIPYTIGCLQCRKTKTHEGYFPELAASDFKDKPDSPPGWEAFWAEDHCKNNLIEEHVPGCCADAVCMQQMATETWKPEEVKTDEP